MVRELFVMARESAPAIIFMDEIDSIGSTRSEGGSGGGDSEVQRTMLELLNQLDGFEPTQNIKVSGWERNPGPHMHPCHRNCDSVFGCLCNELKVAIETGKGFVVGRHSAAI